MKVLLVANFAPNAGYAWNTIEGVFRGIALRLVADGARVCVSYPSFEDGPPRQLADLDVVFVEADYHRVRQKNVRHVVRFLRLLRRERVRILYLTDRPTWSLLYPLFRLAGVKKIIIHKRVATESYDPDSTPPGRRMVPKGISCRMKHLAHRIGPLSGDRYVAVSDFVKYDLLEVHGTPARHTFRIYNGIEMERFDYAASDRLKDLVPAVAERPVVFMASRAHHVKGIQILIEAADLLNRRGRGDIAVVFCGDGPVLPELRASVESRGLSDSFFFLGARNDVNRLLPCATIAVVPSLWKEAFGLSVVEAMASAVPVIASRTGGIPEIVTHERTGLLVPPGDASALAAAIERLLGNDELRRGIAREGRRVARRRFSMDRTIDGVYEVFRPLVAESVSDGGRLDLGTELDMESFRCLSPSDK